MLVTRAGGMREAGDSPVEVERCGATHTGFGDATLATSHLRPRSKAGRWHAEDLTHFSARDSAPQDLTKRGRIRHDGVDGARAISGAIRVRLVKDEAGTERRFATDQPIAGRAMEHEFREELDPASIGAMLRSRARALGANAHEADDLAQETIARILARAPDKRGHAGYATRTLTRLWLDQQRSLRMRARRLRRVAAGMIAGSAPLHITDDARSAVVFAAIQTLPPKQRAALVLRLVEGLGYAAIAEAIGCTEEAARASLHEARARLRKELTQRGIEP